MPEVDAFAWADETELEHRLAHSMRRLLLLWGLLSHAKGWLRL